MTTAEQEPTPPLQNLDGSGRIIRRVREYAPIELPAGLLFDETGELDLYPEIGTSDYIQIHLSGGKVRLQAGGRVGVIPLNERVAIDVVPRVPVGNLLRLLSISEHAPEVLAHERSYAREGAWDDSLINIYAQAIAAHAESISSSGIYRAYQRREEHTSFPRGRVLITPTIQQLHSRGLQHRAAVTRFERSADNAPNRCIKYAIWFVARRLVQLGAASSPGRQLLARLGVAFESLRGVRLDHQLTFLSDPEVQGRQSLPPLRSYYRPALNLAIAIIRQHGIRIEGQQRGIGLPSLVLNMNDIFERYLRNVLQAQAHDRSWQVEVLDGNTYGKKLLFDAKPSEEVTPDIVIRDPSDGGSVPLVIEVKNVPVGQQSKRSHIEQVITYGASYRCSRLMLVHPRGYDDKEGGLAVQGEIDGTTVYKFTFDLAADSLVEGEAEFADEVGLLAEQPSANTASVAA